MIEYAQEALDHIDALAEHYLALDRPGAVARLDAALRDAEARIERAPHAGLPTARPYPATARPGVAWILSGRYWIAYQTRPALVILTVFYDQANIPGRFSEL